MSPTSFMVPAVLREPSPRWSGAPRSRACIVHGEKAAAYMADGYARVRQARHLHGAGDRALNLAAGLRDASLAHSPVIAMTGGRDPKTKFRKVYQEIDDVPAFEPVTKFNATIDDVARFPTWCGRFRVATSGTPGPCTCSSAATKGRSMWKRRRWSRLCEPQFAACRRSAPEPEDARVTAALEHLQAERPVIVAGGGVRASGAGAELVALPRRCRSRWRPRSTART